MPDDPDAAAAELTRLVRHFRRELWYLEHPFPEIAALLELADGSLSGIQLPLPLVDQTPFAALPDYPASGQPHIQQGEVQRAKRLPVPGKEAAQQSAPTLASLPGKPAGRRSTVNQPPTATTQTIPKAPTEELPTGPVFSMRGLASEKPSTPGQKPAPPGESARKPALPTPESRALPTSRSQAADLSPAPDGLANSSSQPPINPAQVAPARGLDLVAPLVQSIQENRVRLNAAGSAPVSQPGSTPFFSKTSGPEALGSSSGIWRPGRAGDQVIRIHPEMTQQDRMPMPSPPLIQGNPDTRAQLELHPSDRQQPLPQNQPSSTGDSGPSTITTNDRLAAPGSAAAAGMDPGQLAELVNQALVEQARRYGVDIS